MLLVSHCKINLGLYVTKKRDDSFHELETVMYPISNFSDVVELIPSSNSGSNEFISSGLELNCSADNNLCMKALMLIQERYNTPPSTIHLHKQVPFGAGLGGGSANATTILKLCNIVYSLLLTDETLEHLASELGSDTAFFVRNTPSLATGRGEILSPIDLTLSNYKVEITIPNIHISTKEAYSGITPKISTISIAEIIESPIATWRDTLINDFEESLFIKYPELSVIKADLYHRGAVYASLSGSGSSIYGLFPL